MRFFLLGLILVLSTRAAIALPQDFTDRQNPAQHRFDDKVFGYAWTTSMSGQKPLVTFRFSNSKKFGGDRRVSAVALFRSGADVIRAVRVSKNIGDPFLKGTKVTDAYEPIELTPEQWATVTSIEYHFGSGMTKQECKALPNPMLPCDNLP